MESPPSSSSQATSVSAVPTVPSIEPSPSLRHRHSFAFCRRCFKGLSSLLTPPKGGERPPRGAVAGGEGFAGCYCHQHRKIHAEEREEGSPPLSGSCVTPTTIRVVVLPPSSLEEGAAPVTIEARWGRSY
ncbi:hypothetical protein AHAS_Ahas13G0318900 [Arachis hypogaea]